VVETLDNVDKFVAAWWDEPYDAKVYCNHMDLLVEVGFCALLNEGGCYIGENSVRGERSKEKGYWNVKVPEPERPSDHMGYLMRVDWLNRREGEEDLQFEARNAKFKAFLQHMFYIKYRFHAYG
jgi:hypothetical protein